MRQLRRGKDLNDKEFEEHLLAALQSEDNEALDVLLSDSTTAPLESTDTTKDQSEVSSFGPTPPGFDENREYENESVSSAAPLESEEPQDTTIDDASLDTQELSYLSSDSNSETIMVILT